MNQEGSFLNIESLEITPRVSLIYLSRCQVNYECLPGFKLEGRKTRICEKDGVWSQVIVFSNILEICTHSNMYNVL